MAKKKVTTEPVAELEELKVETKGKSKMANNTSDSIVELDMDLDSYADYEALPAGPFPAECILGEKRISDNGNEYFYLQFLIHPDDFPADYDRENAPEGARLTWACTSVPTAKNRRAITAAKNLLRALGMPTNVNTINAGEFEGKKCKVIINKGEYNGSPNNQIQSLEALD